MGTTVFDPEKFKESTRKQWQNAAKAWNDWGILLRQWLGPATEQMLDMAGVVEGSRVLDIAAGAGVQTMLIAEAVGAKAHVLATDISSNILEFARECAAGGSEECRDQGNDITSEGVRGPRGLLCREEQLLLRFFRERSRQ